MCKQQILSVAALHWLQLVNISETDRQMVRQTETTGRHTGRQASKLKTKGKGKETL
jgi:hypothetical protein